MMARGEGTRQGQGQRSRRVRQRSRRQGDEGSEPLGQGSRAEGPRGSIKDAAGKVERKVRGK